MSRASLGEIASLTYADTVSRRAEYHVGEEDEILKQCVTEIGRASR